jgi:hypothetical protein
MKEDSVHVIITKQNALYIYGIKLCIDVLMFVSLLGGSELQVPFYSSLPKFQLHFV